MKVVLSLLVAVRFVAVGSPAAAQESGASRLFTAEVIERALSDMPIHVQAPPDPRADWSRVQRLARSTEIVVSARGLTSRKGRLVAVTDTTLTIVDLDDRSRPTIQIPRDDVLEIKQWNRGRGSWLGAVIGTGGGVLLGVGSAVTLAYKQCGGSCSDEKFLMGLSIVGLPIAGGLAGYYLPKSGRTLTTIYTKP